MDEFWDILDSSGNKIGRLHKRGEPMADDDFHLVVHVWIVNINGKLLISKRTVNKNFPLMWECTGGSAVAGDDSLTTAIKEAQEELGINLVPENGSIFTRIKRDFEGMGGDDFVDVWIFRQEVNIDEITFNPDETCDAKWASPYEICKMINNGEFIGRDIFPYIDELFEHLR